MSEASVVVTGEGESGWGYMGAFKWWNVRFLNLGVFVNKLIWLPTNDLSTILYKCYTSLKFSYEYD